MSAPESIVLTVRLRHRGVVHTASYFVEHGVVHANIGHRVLAVPLANGNAPAIVTTLLREHLAQVSPPSTRHGGTVSQSTAGRSAR